MPDIKTVKKAEHFWKHGKHKGVLQALLMSEKTKIKKPKPEMFDTVQEAFQAAKKKKK